MAVSLTGTGITFSDGKVQSTGKQYDTVTTLSADTNMNSVAYYRQIVNLNSSCRNITLPSVGSSNTGDAISFQNSTPYADVLINRAGSDIIFAYGGNQTQLRLRYHEHMTLVNMGGGYWYLTDHTMASNYIMGTGGGGGIYNGTSFTYGSWYQVPADGWVSVRAQGDYMSGGILYAGISTTNYYEVAVWGHDFNYNTWRGSLLCPVRGGTYVLATNWWTDGIEYAECIFYPGKRF
jgi:hypothetical protein